MADDSKSQCPRCNKEASIAVRRCAGTSCRVELGYCSYCRQLSTFEGGRCERCDGAVTACIMQRLGTNCNGYARAQGLGGVFCDRCRERTGAIMRWGFGAYAVSAMLNLLRPKK